MGIFSHFSSLGSRLLREGWDGSARADHPPAALVRCVRAQPFCAGDHRYRLREVLAASVAALRSEVNNSE